MPRNYKKESEWERLNYSQIKFRVPRDKWESLPPEKKAETRKKASEILKAALE